MLKIKPILLFQIAFVLMIVSTACGTEETSEQETDAQDPNENEEVEDFPSGNINLSTPFSAGGPGDSMVREVAQIMSEELGIDENIIVENREGGTGAVALTHMLEQPADGHTLLNDSPTTFLSMAAGQSDFTPEDMLPVAAMLSNYQVISVREDSPIETIEDLIDDAQENPGEINMAGSFTYSPTHIFALQFMDATDTDINFISYDSGGAEATAALLGGNTEVMVSTGGAIHEHVEAGDIRPLAVSSVERVEDYPDVPTFGEVGIEELEDELTWRAFFLHPDTPSAIREQWIDILETVSETEAFAEYAETMGEDVDFRAGDEFEGEINEYYADAERLFDEGIED